MSLAWSPRPRQASFELRLPESTSAFAQAPEAHTRPWFLPSLHEWAASGGLPKVWVLTAELQALGCFTLLYPMVIYGPVCELKSSQVPNPFKLGLSLSADTDMAKAPASTRQPGAVHKGDEKTSGSFSFGAPEGPPPHPLCRIFLRMDPCETGKTSWRCWLCCRPFDFGQMRRGHHLDTLNHGVCDLCPFRLRCSSERLWAGGLMASRAPFESSRDGCSEFSSCPRLGKDCAAAILRRGRVY